MKNLLTVLSLLVGLSAFAQVPQTINYQAIVRDGAGEPITSGNVDIRFTIAWSGGSWSEVHANEPVGDFGLVNVEVGSQDAVGFAGIQWQMPPLTIQIDVNPGSGYVTIGNQPLNSVPFSIHSAVSDSVAGVDLSAVGSSLWTNGGGGVYTTDNVGIGADPAGYNLDIRSTTDAMLNISSSGAALGTRAALRLSMNDGYTGTVYRFGAEKSDATANSGQSDLFFQKEFSTGGGYLKFLRYDNSTNNVIINDSKTTASAYGDLLISNGNVGIGTDPTYALDVAGNAGFDEYLYHNDNTGTRIRFLTDRILLATAGLSNIDITEPQTLVFAATPGTDPLESRINSEDASIITKSFGVTNFNKNPTDPGFGPAMTFYGTNGGVNVVEMAQITSVYDDPSEGGETTSIGLRVRNGGGPLTERLLLDYNGQLHLSAYGGGGNRMLVVDNTGAVTPSALPAGGDITAVTAGTGLTGGGTTGSVTVNAIGGNGLTESANDIDLGGALTNNTVITQGLYSFDINLSSTGDFAIQDAGTDVFFVRDDGDVGIGTNAPNERLDVEGNIEIDGEYTYESAKTRYLHLGPWDFMAKDGEQVVIHGGQGYFNFRAEPDLQDPSAFAPLHLPNGATVTSVYIRYLDNVADNLTMELLRYGTTDANTSFGSVSSTESAFVYSSKTLTPTPALTISNVSYKYVLKITSPVTNNNHRIYSVRVAYTVDRAD